MPLKINDEDDTIEFWMGGEFRCGWRKQPLSQALVEAMVNEAYQLGKSDGAQVLEQMRQVINEAE